MAKLLGDSDLSRFGSDVEDLDEDCVTKANLPDGEEEEETMVKGNEVTCLQRVVFLRR